MRIQNSFIPVRGVGTQTERELWAAGVTNWEQFDPTVSVVGQTRADRIEAFIQQAQRRLAARDSTFFRSAVPDREHWRLYENFRDRTAFLDIETTGLDHDRDRVTTVSIHRDDETITLVRGHDLSAQRLRAELDAADLLVTFNGRRFDVPFLEASFDLEITLPHVDLWTLNRQLGYSGGLTDVEARLGIDRDQPDISGADAVRLWQDYQAGRDGALETLIDYNQTDTVNMQPIADTLCDRLHEEVFAPAVPR